MSTHLEKFKKCFLKCREYGISLNSERCACSGTILGFIVSKKGKPLHPKKINALVKMPVPNTPHDIQVFNGMTQFYRCFIKKFASIMASITKLLKKIEVFEWIDECQTAWEDIKNRYIQAPVLISPN
jgi:hypothetical protein